MKRVEDDNSPKIKFTPDQREVLIKTHVWVEKFFIEEEKNFSTLSPVCGFLISPVGPIFSTSVKCSVSLLSK